MNGLRQDWKGYLNKNGGRRKFQIDLGLSIIYKGIEIDWPEPHSKDTKPIWMNKNVVPCECAKCFFCLNRMTTGITHGEQGHIIFHSPGSGKRRK